MGISSSLASERELNNVAYCVLPRYSSMESKGMYPHPSYMIKSESLATMAYTSCASQKQCSRWERNGCATYIAVTPLCDERIRFMRTLDNANIISVHQVLPHNILTISRSDNSPHTTVASFTRAAPVRTVAEQHLPWTLASTRTHIAAEVLSVSFGR